jgi:hypothetical protein
VFANAGADLLAVRVGLLAVHVSSWLMLAAGGSF